MSIENLTAKATVIYTRTVDRAASFLNTKKDLEERSQLKKEKLLSALTKKAPADFLNDAIDKRIAMAQKPKRGEISRASQPAVESAAAFVSTTSSVTMSKDDFAPFVSEAPADDKRAAKKFPGLGKGKGKGKSRAASHFPNEGTKGQGKGKSYGLRHDGLHGGLWPQSPWSPPSVHDAKGGKPKHESVFHYGRKGKAKGGKTGNTTKGKGKGKGFPRGHGVESTAIFALDQGDVHR